MTFTESIISKLAESKKFLIKKIDNGLIKELDIIKDNDTGIFVIIE